VSVRFPAVCPGGSTDRRFWRDRGRRSAVLLCVPEDFGTELKSAKGGWFESGLFHGDREPFSISGGTGGYVDAQGFLVDVSYPLVGPGKTIARVVDLLLGEVLDYEEVLSGVVRFAQFAVSCNHVRALDHETRLVPTA
jgi:hypothetical protein